VYNVTLRRVRTTIVAAENRKYYVFWVDICSVRYPACNALALYLFLWLVRLYNIFISYLINGAIFEKVIDHKICFDLLYNVVWNISHSKKSWARYMERDISRCMTKNLYWSSGKTLIILVQVLWNLKFLERFSKNSQISNFMKIRPVGAEVLNTDWQTDRQTWGN
jgi:hypothetical protein